MAKVRSPNYPNLSLGPALDAIRAAYTKDHRNKMSRAVLANHMGYTSLNGRALGKIGAVRAYGLIEGSGDELKISDDAVTALMAPVGSKERTEALARLANKPQLFQELRKDFPTTMPSMENLKFALIKRQFTPDAAEKAAKSYLATMNLVAGIPDAYNPPEDEDDLEADMQETVSETVTRRSPAVRAADLAPLPDDQPLVVVMNGERLNIKASVDLEGLRNLREILEKYEGILQMMQKMNPDKKEAAH